MDVNTDKKFSKLAQVPVASMMTDHDYILIVSGNSVRRIDAAQLLARLKRIEDFFESHTLLVAD